MYIRLAVLVLLFLLSGCNSAVTFSEISIKQANEDVLEFIETVKEENGRYLYTDEKNQIYVFLNGKFKQLGSDAVHFTAFYISAQQDTLNVFFNQEYDSDYLDNGLKYQALYKISTIAEFEMINLFSNGEPVSFDRVFSRE